MLFDDFSLLPVKTFFFEYFRRQDVKKKEKRKKKKEEEKKKMRKMFDCQFVAAWREFLA